MDTINSEVSEIPRYSGKTKNGWSIEMRGTEAIDGSDQEYVGSFGDPLINFTVEGSGIKKARVRNSRGKWLPYSTGFDTAKGLGNDKSITGIEIVGKGYKFAIHILGGQWLPVIRTSDVEGEILGTIGCTIDGIWVDKI